MARPLRIEFPGALYHVTARGNERKPIYRADSDRDGFLNILADLTEHFRLVVHAYVLMGNHYHLLLQTLEANLSRAMRELDGTYAQSFNRAHRRVGHLFQGRYTAILVDRDSYLVELSRYIHLNAVRAGIAPRAEEHEWSSVRAYLGKCARPTFLTVSDVLAHFDAHPVRARRLYAQFLRQGVGARSPFEQVVGQTLLGAPQWVERMQARIAERPHTHTGVAVEVPALRQLARRPSFDQVISAVTAETGTAPAAMYRRGGRARARALAMYLAHTEGGLPLWQIGAAFNVGHFAVSRAVARIERERLTQRHLRGLLDRLTSALRSPPPSQRQVPPQRESAFRTRPGAARNGDASPSAHCRRNSRQ